MPMDINRFTSPAGQLIPIEQLEKKDWAFIPSQMPPDWEFPVRLWPLLADAKEALGRLDGIGRTLPDPELLLTPLRNREALTSSRLEGTYVTPQQLLLYGLDPRQPSSEAASEWREVFNYSRALQIGGELLETLPFCLRVVREMHSALMNGLYHRAHAGNFRAWQVQIGATGRFIPPPAEYVTQLMSNLELYINSVDDRFDPLVRCYLVHYQFETIHPFADGNGRIGRVLLALMVQKWLNHSKPWLYMSAFFERYKDEYINSLFRISATGSWDDWIEFCLTGTIQQANDSIRRCDKFNTLKRRFHEIATQYASPRTHQIIESLFVQPLVTVPHLASQFRVSPPTARSDIHRLVGLGILYEIGKSVPKSFYSPAIFQIAYGEPEEVSAINGTGDPPIESQ